MEYTTWKVNVGIKPALKYELLLKIYLKIQLQWLSEQMECENLQIGKTAVALWIPMTQK